MFSKILHITTSTTAFLVWHFLMQKLADMAGLRFLFQPSMYQWSVFFMSFPPFDETSPIPRSIFRRYVNMDYSTRTPKEEFLSAINQISSTSPKKSSSRGNLASLNITISIKEHLTNSLVGGP